jgi:hypothetical protein
MFKGIKVTVNALVLAEGNMEIDAGQKKAPVY